MKYCDAADEGATGKLTIINVLTNFLSDLSSRISSKIS